MLAVQCSWGAPTDNAKTNAWPHFQEVLHLLRDELKGVQETDLNEAMVEGLLRQLHPRVLIESREALDSTSGRRLGKQEIIEQQCGLLRVAEVGQGLDEEIRSAVRGWRESGKTISGLILDLRFSKGLDYAAAAKAAAQFLNEDADLLDFGQGMTRGGSGTNAIAIPSIILVNGKTSGSSEAFAALMRQNSGSLILGSATANQARIYKQVALSNGKSIQVASGKITLPAEKDLSDIGLKPDLVIEVPADQERLYWENPYRPPALKTAAASRNSAAEARRRMNEAELVRRQREGLEPEDGIAPEFNAAAIPVETRPSLQDPVLARAVDLIKGIEAMRKSK